MADATKIQLGPCSVRYKGTDLGHTIGGVVVTYTPTYKETSVDQHGSSVVEKFLTGERMMAELSLAEFTLANLQVAIGQSNLVGDDSVSMGSNAGKKASEKAGELVLHPLALPSSDRNSDVTIFKAVVTNELKIEHSNENEKVLPVQFDGLIDEGRADGARLGYIGDSIS